MSSELSNFENNANNLKRKAGYSQHASLFWNNARFCKRV